MTQPQHMRALAKANGVRLGRSDVKHAVRDGRLSVGDALRHPAVQTMAVGDLLAAQRGWGEHRVIKMLTRLTWRVPRIVVSWSRPVGKLTQRERIAVIEACGERDA